MSIKFNALLVLSTRQPALLVARFTGDDRDSGQSLAMLAERVAHRQHPLACVTIDEQVPGKAQRPEEPFVGDHSTRLQRAIGAVTIRSTTSPCSDNSRDHVGLEVVKAAALIVAGILLLTV
jgi:hypothetical protein